jgi:hypothetical protein
VAGYIFEQPNILTNFPPPDIHMCPDPPLHQEESSGDTADDYSTVDASIN